MRTTLLFCLLLWLPLAPLGAQMISGQDTLYGNEWIDYDKDYYRIEVAEDGLYRVPQEVLSSAGIDVAGTAGSRYQLWRMGQEVPLYVSSAGPLQPGDYLEFYGQKNRSELDRFLFEDPETMLNPWYSLYTDTMAYYLTVLPPGEAGLRYEEVEHELVDLPGVEEWFWGEERVVFEGAFEKKGTRVGALINDNSSSLEVKESTYYGDGFSTGFKKVQTFTVTPIFPANNGLDGRLEMRLLSNANAIEEHQLNIRLNGTLVYEDSLQGSDLLLPELPVSSPLLDGALEVQVSGLLNNDAYAIGGAVLTYPRSFNFGGGAYAKIRLPEAGGARFLELQGLEAESELVLYDTDQRKRYLPALSAGDIWQVKLEAGNGQRHLIADGDFQEITTVRPLQFRDFSGLSASYLIITHTHLRQGEDFVGQYAQYRSSAEGGAHQVEILDIEELYEQFAYGIHRHPLSVRNAVHHFLQNGVNLEYCFLVGKGRTYSDIRRGSALESAVQQNQMLVPTFGSPPSDNLMLGWPGKATASLVHGRLAATRPQDIQTYLEKVRGLESNRNNEQTEEGRAWVKRVVHLGGGTTSSERATIRNNLQRMGQEITSNGFGGDLRSFFRAGSGPLTASLYQSIFDAVNPGCGIITFFGHSSPGSFDFNIDNPDNYDNLNKYPLMLSLGCYSGDVFTGNTGISERFTFLKDKAAVAFAATPGIGFIDVLSNFGESLYGKIGDEHYGQGLGKAVQAALSETPYEDIRQRILVQQFLYHGDPAVRLPVLDSPDLIFDAATVTTDPGIVSAVKDSFELAFDILNIGRSGAFSFDLEVEQTFPDGQRQLVREIRLSHEGFRQHHTLRLPLRQEMVGQNTYFLTLDTGNEIEEQALEGEANNEFRRQGGSPGLDLYIIDNSARPVWPPDFSVVSDAPVALQASTTNALAGLKAYSIEIDTTPLYNSPLRRQTRLQQKGGILTWTPSSLPMLDSTSYFWRIRPDSSGLNDDELWAEYTFTYIENGASAWRQGEYNQWQKSGDGERVLLDENSRSFSFEEGFIDLQIRNKVDKGGVRPSGFINGNRWSDFFRWEAKESINITVFDNSGQIVWNPKPGQYGSLNTTASKEIANFAFPVATSEQRLNIINFLDTIVQPGYTVFFYTAIRDYDKDLNVSEWAADSLLHPEGKNIFSVVEGQGAEKVRQLQSEMRPYIFVYKKEEQVLAEKIAESIEGEISHTEAIQGPLFDGSFTSPLIGPARQWGQLDWEYELSEDSDTIGLTVIGYTADFIDSVLYTNVKSQNLNLTEVNSREFPYLKLRFEAFDDSLTIPQVRHWAVSYRGSEELAIDPNASYLFESDTLQQGATLRFASSLRRLGRSPDSLVQVRYRIISAGSEVAEEQIDTLELNDAGTTELNYSYETQSLNGNYNLRVDCSPASGRAEHHQFNNVINQRFTVVTDREAPFLQVTFDGKRIIDGALVSNRPSIQVNLLDNNPYLLLTDTSSLRLFLGKKGETPTPIYYTDDRILFEPAVGERNEATILFNPVIEESGLYELQVQGVDASGNFSGAYNYQVTFEVDTKATVANVLNYPNPFSTSTQFVYTLTGQELPMEFTIRIMTISGRIVKEIPLHQLEDLQFGTHRTQYRWDGTDEFGDRLANGVYLYQVIVRGQEGSHYELRENGDVDPFFKGDLGKMVIMR